MVFLSRSRAVVLSILLGALSDDYRSPKVPGSAEHLGVSVHGFFPSPGEDAGERPLPLALPVRRCDKRAEFVDS